MKEYHFRITNGPHSGEFVITAGGEQQAWDLAWQVWWAKQRKPGTKMNLVKIEG